MTEETLSDKILSWDGEPFLLSVEDVKDFIKKLKEETIKEGEPISIITFHEIIDKLAGEELTK